MLDLSLELIKSEFRVDSRLLAPYLDQRHRSILELIDNYPDDFEQISPLAVQTEKGSPLPQGGFAKATRYYLLTEDQCYLLLTYSKNTKASREKKVKLVKAFRDARTQLAKRDIARIEGKQVRHMETDAIRDLIEYAKAHGSRNAEMYYANITKMTNSALGIEAGQRDLLSARKLDEIKMAEMMVKIAISDGLNAGLEYKDIYKLCKDRVASIAKTLLN